MPLQFQIAQRPKRIKLNRLSAPFHLCPMELVAGKVQARGIGRLTRYNNGTAVFLGQAFQACAGIHGIADRGDHLRERRSHRADDGLAVVDADSDPQRLTQVGAKPVIQLV